MVTERDSVLAYSATVVFAMALGLKQLIKHCNFAEFSSDLYMGYVRCTRGHFVALLAIYCTRTFILRLVLEIHRSVVSHLAHDRFPECPATGRVAVEDIYL